MEQRSWAAHDLLLSILFVAAMVIAVLLWVPPHPLSGGALATEPRDGLRTESADSGLRRVADDVITVALLYALARDPLLANAPIAVHTVDGVVALRGFVRERRMRDHAERLAVGTYGVRAVDNRLAVFVTALA